MKVRVLVFKVQLVIYAEILTASDATQSNYNFMGYSHAHLIKYLSSTHAHTQ